MTDLSEVWEEPELDLDLVSTTVLLDDGTVFDYEGFLSETDLSLTGSANRLLKSSS